MKLELCPFCGETPELKKNAVNGVFCDTEGCPIWHVEILIGFWNSRPGEQAARVEALEAAKDAIYNTPFTSYNAIPVIQKLIDAQ